MAIFCTLSKSINEIREKISKTHTNIYKPQNHSTSFYYIHSFGQIVDISVKNILVKYHNITVKLNLFDPITHMNKEIPTRELLIGDWIRFHGRLFFKKRQCIFNHSNASSIGYNKMGTSKNENNSNRTEHNMVRNKSVVFEGDQSDETGLLLIKCTKIVQLEGVDICLVERICQTIENKCHFIK